MKKLVLLGFCVMLLGGCLDWSNTNTVYDKEEDALLRRIEELEQELEELQ